jgi:lysophospholipase L1-like esterase
MWPRIALLCVSILVALGCLELAIRIHDARAGKGFFSDHRNLLAEPVKIRPFRTFGADFYRDRGGERKIRSRHGGLYPLEKPEGAFRIVCLGGSTTENQNNFDDDGTDYPMVLEALLRERLGRRDVEVINVGFSAYSTAHMLITLELDVLSWKPDLIIVSEAVNDLLVTYFPDFAYDYSNKYGLPFYGTAFFEQHSLADTLFQHSQLFWVLKRRADRLFPERGLPIRRRSYGDTPDPVGSATYARNLRSMVALARSNGIRVVLGEQPLQTSEELFKRHFEHKPYNGLVVYPLHDEFVKHHRFYDGIMKQVAEDTEVLFADNDRRLGDRPAYFIDSVHYTAAGLRALAEGYADFLIANDVLR